MTSIQSIKADLRRLKKVNSGKIIVCFEGEPEPEHKPGDHLIFFDSYMKGAL